MHLEEGRVYSTYLVHDDHSFQDGDSDIAVSCEGNSTAQAGNPGSDNDYMQHCFVWMLTLAQRVCNRLFRVEQNRIFVLGWISQRSKTRTTRFISQ